MKQIILIFALIYSVVSLEYGRAMNMITREGGSCVDESKDNDSGVSGCVDHDLFAGTSNARYYDRCCYVRYMSGGQMYGTCWGITREEYMDIVQTIDHIEKGSNMKIYELNCKSSYLQFALVFALLSFLF